MLNKESRDKLRERLSGVIQKAASKVTTEVKAEQGDFKIVLSSKNIDHYYKNQKVAEIRVDELDDEIVEFIQSDPESTCSVMLGEFVKGYNTEAFSKTAAHATQDTNTYQRITEKQMDNQKVSLHPRPEEGHPYRNITEKQLPQHDERHGSYGVITEGQMRDTKATFKNEPMDAAARQNEQRAVITEGQFSDEEQQGSVKQGEIGSEFNGDQTHMITEKQIKELLSHHGWDQPRTITEGRNQLGQQKGELSRLTAEIAEKMLKEAMDALGKTVIALGVTPDEVFNAIKDMTSHPTKETALADILNEKQDVKDIETAFNRRKFHGKIASIDTTSEKIASAVLRQFANIEGDSRHVASALFSIASLNDLSKIAEASESVLQAKEGESTNEVNYDDPKSVFASVLAGKHKFKVEGDASQDGMYQYSGKTSEIDEDPVNQEKFAEKAFDHCKVIVAQQAPVSVKEDNLVPVSVDVDQERGTFDLIMKDVSVTDTEMLKARAEKRRELAKEAETKVTKEAQVPGGAMPPPGGPEMQPAGAPAGAADMGGPPVENFGQEPPAPPGETEPAGEPKPPGSLCPVCGSEDVDVDDGNIRCNVCGAEGEIEVGLRIRNWPGTIEESESKEEEGGGEGEGFELGGGEEGSGLEGMAPPNVPVAASVSIRPKMLEKLSASKIKLGSVCPNCGSNQCDLLGHKGICYACNTEYNVTLLTQKNKPYRLAARFEWTPVTTRETEECVGCNRLKLAFRNALKDYGMTFDEFHSLDSWKAKGDAILKMKKANVLDRVFKEYQNNLPIEKIATSVPARWKGYENVDQFPIDSCMERLNRRFGENASAMSGPCQGKKLAECVCNQLQALGVYSDGLAAKVARVHMSDDPEEKFPTEECIGTMKNEGFRLKEAGFICDCLKAAYASYEDLLIEAVTNQDIKKSSIKKAQIRNRMIEEDEDLPEEATLDESPESIIDEPDEEAVIDETPDVTVDEEITEDIIPESPIEEELGEIPGEGLGDELSGELGEAPEGMVDITLTLSKDTAEEIYDAINEAISPDVGIEGEPVGEESLDIETPEEEVGETIEEELGETPGEEALEEEIGVEPESHTKIVEEKEKIPGELENAEDIATGGELAKEGDEEKERSAPAKPMECEKCAKPEEKTEKKEDEDDKNPCAAPTEEQKQSSLENMLSKMKTGTISKEKDGISNMIDALVKAAQEEPEKFKYLGVKSVKTKERPVQDSTDVKFKDGKVIGHEDKFDAKDPDVPRKKQLLGTEGDDMGVDDTGDMPEIPAGSAALKGEQHYRPEKQEEVDPNQGCIGTTADNKKEVKTAETKEAKGKKWMQEAVKDEGSFTEYCGGKVTQECVDRGKKSPDTKTKRRANLAETFRAQAKKRKGKKSESEQDMKESETQAKFKVESSHKIFNGLKSLYASGTKTVKLSDGNAYGVSVSLDRKAFILTAKGLPEALKQYQFKKKEDKKDDEENDDVKEDKKEKKDVKKEAQTKTIVHKRTNEDDPDINKTTGPGAGKVKTDKPHSMAVNEPAPSEGVSEPDVPRAPNAGQLKREETVNSNLDMPEVPVGGGQNPIYDQDEKKAPEKQEEVLGLVRPLMASHKVDIQKEATRIAGEMLKKGKITPNELNDKIAYLSQLSMPLLKQYEEDILKRTESQNEGGLTKAASADAVESVFIIPASTPVKDQSSSLVESLQSLMTLNSRNEEHRRLVEEKGNLDVFR